MKTALKKKSLNKKVWGMVGAAVIAIAASMPCGVLAQETQTVRLRGTIEKLDDNLLTVKSRDGSDLKVILSDKVLVLGVENASLADIREGYFVGSAAMPQADGSQKALEVHIFPETMRGTGEGHRPYSIPNSTMTNGTVEATVASVDGSVLTLKYKGGEKKIIVSPGIPILRYEVGDKGDLKTGAAFTILSAAKTSDGMYQTERINVGRNGAVPQ
jgi:hypothetical protein